MILVDLVTYPGVPWVGGTPFHAYEFRLSMVGSKGVKRRTEPEPLENAARCRAYSGRVGRFR